MIIPTSHTLSPDTRPTLFVHMLAYMFVPATRLSSYGFGRIELEIWNVSNHLSLHAIQRLGLGRARWPPEQSKTNYRKTNVSSRFIINGTRNDRTVGEPIFPQNCLYAALIARPQQTLIAPEEWIRCPRTLKAETKVHRLQKSSTSPYPATGRISRLLGFSFKLPLSQHMPHSSEAWQKYQTRSCRWNKGCQRNNLRWLSPKTIFSFQYFQT